MVELTHDTINAYRSKTYRINPSSRIHDREEAVQFVNETGFIFFWPIQGIPLPSLWVAAAGDRPVADEHDDPGHITWGWKDELLGQGRWYYGRVLAHKNCMISLALLPNFYALSPNFGEPETDYLDDYHKGILPMEAKSVYEALLKEGPLDSISLRKAAHLSGAGSDSRFNKALEVLQTSFRIVPAGICNKGSWHYAFMYDLFHCQYADAMERSRTVSEQSARNQILRTYFRAIGACTERDLTRVFHWELPTLKQALSELIHSDYILDHICVMGEKPEYYCLSQLA